MTTKTERADQLLRHILEEHYDGAFSGRLPRIERCTCGHARDVHGSTGCEGLLTVFDGTEGVEPCACRSFISEQQAFAEVQQ